MSDRRALIDMLGRTELFHGLTKKELETIVNTSREVDHAAGKDIVHEDAEGVGFHLILSGTAVVTQGGRTLRTLGPGDSFGEIAVIDGGPRSASVQAETPLHTLSITAWMFRPLLLEHAGIAHKLLLELCRRLREAEARPLI